jgi:hypothetical protein
VARAGGACEYCRLLQAATGITFHIEHVLPRFQGGETVLSNLALSCPGCNLAKADRTTGEDRALDRESGMIVPRTPMGEATVITLRMNKSMRVFARKLQVVAGLIG